MGEVREVYDSVLDRDIAMKTAKVDSADMLSRFIQEARITSKLQHPNIPPVHDLGVGADGQHYFTMRRVRGDSLRHLIKKDSIGTLIERLQIFHKICDAMSYAHASGVIHRDLKPSNIMVGEFGVVLVLDWGLAKILGDGVLPVRVTVSGSMQPFRPEVKDASKDSASGSASGSAARSSSSSGSSHETRFGAVMGTPTWMSPEQAMGDTEAVGKASDIYSLGALLYVLLSGKPPFSGRAEETLVDVSTWKVVPPSELSDGHEVPRELDAVVLKAMALHPADRFASVQELRAETQAYLERRPLASANYSWYERIAKFALRHRATVSGALAVAMIALVAFAVGIWRYTADVREARDLAVMEGARAVMESERSRIAESEALGSLVDAKVASADALVREGRIAEAQVLLGEARDLFQQLTRPLPPIDLRQNNIASSFVLPLRRWNAGQVASLALRPDDKQVLVATAEGHATIWELPAAKPLHTYDPTGEKGRGVVVATGGKGDEARLLLLDGTTLRLVALVSGQEIGRADHVQAGFVRAVLIEGERVVLSYKAHGGDYRTWLPGEAGFRDIHWPEEFGMSHFASRDEAFGTVRPGGEATIEIRDVETGKLRWRQKGWERSSVAAGSALMANMDGTELVLMDIASKRARWSAQESNIERVILSWDGSRAFSASGKGQLRAWRGDDGSRIAQLAGIIDRKTRQHIQVSRNGERVLAILKSGEIALWHLGDSTRWTGLRPPSAARGIDLSADGQFLLAACEKGEVAVFDAVAGRILASVKVQGEARQVDLSPDGRNAAIISSEGQVWIWELETGAVTEAFVGDEERGTSIAFVQQGNALAAVGTSGSLEIRSFPELTQLHRNEDAHKGVIWTVQASPDGKRLLTTGRSEADGVIRVWDAESGALLHSRERESGGTIPYGASWSADGKSIASGRHAGNVVVWDLAEDSAQIVAVHGGPAMDVVHSPDGSMIATTGYDGVVAFLDAKSLIPFASFPRHKEPGLDAVFSADGSSFATTASNQQVQVWDLGRHTRLPALASAIDDDIKQSRSGLKASERLARLAVAGEYWDEAANLWQSIGDAGGVVAPIDQLRAFGMAGRLIEARAFLLVLSPKERSALGIRAWSLWLEQALPLDQLPLSD
jgi:WD40 repeat protein